MVCCHLLIMIVSIVTKTQNFFCNDLDGNANCMQSRQCFIKCSRCLFSFSPNLYGQAINIYTRYNEHKTAEIFCVLPSQFNIMTIRRGVELYLHCCLSTIDLASKATRCVKKLVGVNIIEQTLGRIIQNSFLYVKSVKQ